MKNKMSVLCPGVVGHSSHRTPCNPKRINGPRQLPLLFSGFVCLVFLLAHPSSGWADAVLTLSNYSETNGATIILESLPGETWEVQYASDLNLTLYPVTWTPLGTIELGQADVGQIVDPAAATVSNRVYRARMLGSVQAYSMNIVGFLKTPVPNGYALIANPFQNSFPISQITNLPEGVLIWKPSGSSWDLNWYSQTLGWGNPDMQLNLGKAFWIYNPGSARSIVFKGEVLAGSAPIPGTRYVLATLVGPVDWWREWINCPSYYQVFKYNPLTQSFQTFTFEPDSGEWVPILQLHYGDAFYLEHSCGIISGIVASPVINAPGITFTGYSGPVVEWCGGTPISGCRFRAQVYAGTNWTESELVPVSSPVCFLSGTLAGYVPPVLATLPFTAQNTQVFLQLRAWDYTGGPTYEAALSNHARTGKSPLISLTHYGGIIGGITLTSNFNAFTLNTGTTVTAQVQDRVVLKLCGPIGTKYQVEWADVLSTNSWQVLTNFALPYSPFPVIDGDSIGKPQRFYRTLQVE